MQGKKEVSSIENRDDKVSTTIKEDFALRRRRLEDFLAEEQERLQNFLFEESSVLAAHESEGVEQEVGDGVVEGEEQIRDATPVPESETENIVNPSHMLLGQNIELQGYAEGEKIVDQEKEKETMEKLGLTRKSVGNVDSSQVGLLAPGAFAKTPQLRSRKNEPNQGIGSEKRNEDNWSVGEKQKKKQVDEVGYYMHKSLVNGGGGFRNDTTGASVKFAKLEKPDFHRSVKPGRTKADEPGMKEKEGEHEQKQMEGDEHEHQHEHEPEHEHEHEQMERGEHEQGDNQDDQDYEHKDEQKERDEHGQGHEDSSTIEDTKEGEGGDRLRRVSEECQKDQKFLIKVNHAQITS